MRKSVMIYGSFTIKPSSLNKISTRNQKILEISLIRKNSKCKNSCKKIMKMQMRKQKKIRNIRKQRQI